MGSPNPWTGIRRQLPAPAFLALAVVQALLLAGTIVYGLWPPPGFTGTTMTPLFLVLQVAILLLTLTVVPRLPWWVFEACIAVTSVLLMTVTFVRGNGNGQIFPAITILLMTAFCLSFLPPAHAAAQSVFAVLGYSAALYLNLNSVGAVIFMLVLIVIVGGAVLLGAARANDRRYRLLIDYAADVVFHSTRDTVRWISPSIREMLGWSPEELTGTSIHHLWHADDYQAATDMSARAYSGTPGLGVFRCLAHDGDYVWTEISFKPFEDRGEKGVVGSMRDVSARVAAEEALIASEHDYREMASAERVQRRHLVELEEVRARLFENISHELRTPIAMIQGPLQDLLADQSARLSERRREDLGSALRSSRQLERLVDGLLEIARGQAGDLVLKPQVTDLADLTGRVVSEFQPAARAARLELSDSAVAIPPRLLVDRELWAKVLSNLLSNAIKFTPTGQIAVNLSYASGIAELRVSDSGVGIDEADVLRIFHRFQVAREQPIHGDSGAGIGLAVVSQLVTAAGGTVSARSERGVGTSFTVTMPAPRSDGPIDADPPSLIEMVKDVAAGCMTSSHDASGPADLGTAAQERGRVLLVEDHADLRDYVERLLTRRGWTVTTAAGADEALETVSAVDLVVTDVMMPGAMDGLGLARWIRAQPLLRWMPIIILTARTGRESELEALAAGADDFVTKPFDPDDFVARVGAHMELALLRRSIVEDRGGRAASLPMSQSGNRAIGSALGILMESEGISAFEAFSYLTQLSQAAQRPLREVADDIVQARGVDAAPSGQA